MSETSSKNFGRTWRFALPLAIFFGLVWFMWKGLSLNPRELPSALINKPVPVFSLPQLHDNTKTLSSADMKGKVWLLNVWASWCAPCRQELPTLVTLSQRDKVPVYGLNYKDQPEKAKALLRIAGNPYAASAVDADGRVGLDFGIQGVPETFVIDGKGIVRLRHLGPVTPEVWQDKLMPAIKALR